MRQHMPLAAAEADLAWVRKVLTLGQCAASIGEEYAATQIEKAYIAARVLAIVTDALVNGLDQHTVEDRELGLAFIDGLPGDEPSLTEMFDALRLAVVKP